MSNDSPGWFGNRIRKTEIDMRHADTKFLRAVAILLILNSHLDKFYPISALATGGSIGNSMFFFLSAYGLSLSQHARNQPFVAWWMNRLMRIFPALWLVLILISLPLSMVQNKLNGCSFETIVGYFFNPPYWFLQTLLVFYLLAFPLFNKTRQGMVPKIIFLLAIIYIGAYLTCIDLSQWSIEETPFDRIHYLMIFLFGICIAARQPLANATALANGGGNLHVQLLSDQDCHAERRKTSETPVCGQPPAWGAGLAGPEGVPGGQGQARAPSRWCCSGAPVTEPTPSRASSSLWASSIPNT